MRKRFAISYDAARGAVFVDLPSYRMVSGTWQPVTPGLIHADGIDPEAKIEDAMVLGPSVEVELPDDTPLDEVTGAIDAAALRVMYADHPKFGAEDFTPAAEVKG